MLSENAVLQGSLWGWRPADWAECIEPGLTPLYEAALDLAGATSPGVHLLDAGCGTGGATLAALQRGVRVSAFDAAEGFLEFARTRLPSTVELRRGDLQAIPYEDDSFDSAVAINCVQFTADPSRAVQELARVSRGRVAVVVWTRPSDCDMRHITEKMMSLFPKRPQHRGAFELASPGEIEGILESAGLRIDDAREIELVQVQADLDTAVCGIMSTGPNHRASQILGEVMIAEAVREVIASRFVQPDGSVVMTNYFRCVAASRAG